MLHRVNPDRTETEPVDLIRLTNDRGERYPESDPEPHPGSVVLTEGPFGTAWQRHFSDGLWHSTRGGRSSGRTWEWLSGKRNLFLAYDAPLRDGA